MVKAYVATGLGIGCNREVADALERAGAVVEQVHIRQLLSGEQRIADGQILDLPGGFLHGDILGAGMCAANELEHAVGYDGKRIKDQWLEFVERGGVIYGQCNGFQLLVKAGLLPGIGMDYDQQTVTLTDNDCGVYRVSPVMHRVATAHFAFEGIDTLLLWCRHGEGKIQFAAAGGSVPQELGEARRSTINANHTLLRYVHPETLESTAAFPHNPNGSVDGIAGLVDLTGRIFGHMAHTEVSVYASRDPRWFAQKDQLRRQGIGAAMLTGERMEGQGLAIFRNIVNYFR